MSAEATATVDAGDPLGVLELRERDGELIGVRFAPGARVRAATTPALVAAAAQLEQYLAGERQTFDLALRLVAGAFDRPVLEAVAAIPFGERVSYGEITASVGLPRDHAQRVGAAVGRNPLAIVVPCHRVVGADGSLTGYGGGLARKAALLDLESHQLRLAL